ncbi:hypothetical protein GUJ93_ZPchr0011g27152 [Zizania palustris]|uniref:Uncharacterized protein n=1 Tax=Zizania palustris TaxID=103762 RepID=A0A8J5WJD9_ZIZPA|nr:hypothetical protein GUJ93_ZPchr0011g27152 [Zizania palustris]
MQAPRVPVPATGSSCEPSVPPAIGSSDSSWVVEMENMINSTEKPQQRARHSIYRVPEYIKDRTKRDAYRPKLVSLGPFHHGDPVLLPMEAHKRRAVVQLVKRSGKPLREFIAAVEKIYDQLHEAYENLDKAWHPKRFVELMVIDGCFFLEVMRMFSLRGKVEKDYGSDDPIFSEHGYLYLKDNIISDVLLIENQLPSLLLQNLMFLTVDPKTFQVNNQVHTFLDDILTPASPINNHLGLHPLDILHKSVCGERGYYRKSTLESEMHPASVLHEAGIHFKLHPGAGNDVTAFVYFLDILIDTPKDVTLLRSKGIIENGFGSDEEVANLINKTLSKGAVKSPNSNINNVLEDMTMHCKKMWNKWRATFIHTYFINPWVFSSLIAAFILLFATVTQTIYTGTSFYQKK